MSPAPEGTCTVSQNVPSGLTVSIAEITILVPSHVDELMQERRNSTANALELRLSCTNPSMYSQVFATQVKIRHL